MSLYAHMDQLDQRKIEQATAETIKKATRQRGVLMGEAKPKGDVDQAQKTVSWLNQHMTELESKFQYKK